MTPPTQEQLFEDQLEQVHRQTDDSWRHGCYVTEVYFRKEDSTYWQVDYQLQTDGEYNGLRDGAYDCAQVVPVEVVTKKYVPVPQEVK